MSPRYRISASLVKTEPQAREQAEQPATSCPAWAAPLLAVQFLTRIPVPALARLSGEQARIGLGRAVAWFPLVGTLIGTITAATWLLAGEVWPSLIAVILALIVEARLTGAFHEDAVADFCDGAGGGRDAAHVRQIMKDSRIGSYGALGLALAVALRVALIYSFVAPYGALAIIAAATFGRLLAVITMLTTPPVPGASGLAALLLTRSSAARRLRASVHHGSDDSEPCDITATLRTRDIAFALLLSLPGLLPFAFGAPRAVALATAAAVVFLIWFRALLIKKIGGSTGDCLGFAAYAGQLILLLAATAW